MSAMDELIKVRGRQNLDPSELQISGTDPVFNSAFKIGEVAAAAHASVGVAVNDIWELKTSRRQKIQISVRSAAASLNSNKFIETRHASGEFLKLVDRDHEFNRQLNGIYRTKDGRWCCHISVLTILEIVCWVCWKLVPISCPYRKQSQNGMQ